jgi:hypothetical protein
MCNAHNHPPGCDCGFGPPYPGILEAGSGTEWAEEVIDEPWLAERGLTELGWDERAIDAFLAEYEDLMGAADRMPRAGIVHQIKEMLAWRRVVEEEHWIEKGRVPLFRFYGPESAGSDRQVQRAGEPHRRCLPATQDLRPRHR